MNYLSTGWSIDPMLFVCIALSVVYERGLARLARRAKPERTRRRRRNSWKWYAGMASLLLSICSPIDHFADDYFFVHMFEHVLLMFVAPMFVVAAAPWIPLAHGIPLAWRRRIGRAVLLSPGARPLRALGRFVRHGWVPVVLLNVDMVLWHVPAVFDLGERNQLVHVVLMHGSFLVCGFLFWLQVMPSYPFQPKLSLAGQMGAIISTNVVMFILAMALSIFTNASWYSVYDHIPGVSLPPFADQQIGAALLWICGDFWAGPILIRVIRRAMEEEDGGISVMLDRLLQRAGLPELGSGTRP